MSFTLKIKEMREAKGLSYKELAEKSGVSRSYIVELEEGLYNPTVDIVCKLAIALECNVNELLECCKIKRD